jgi:hypothetical protein
MDASGQKSWGDSVSTLEKYQTCVGVEEKKDGEVVEIFIYPVD